MVFTFKNQYLQGVYDKTAKCYANEPEFLQAVGEVLQSLEPVVAKDPSYETNGVIDRIVEPERMISFRVSWVDDNGKVQVNRSILQLVRTRAVCVCIRLFARLLSSSWALNRSSRTA